MEFFSSPWFIGIGTAVVAGLIVELILYFVFGKGKKKPKLEPDKTVTNTQSNIQSLSNNLNTSPSVAFTPQDIQKELHKLPPFQVEQAAKNYEGIQVKWTVVLSSIFSLPTGDKYIITRIKDTMSPTITCPIDIEDYPQLKVIKNDQPFIIEGTIASVILGNIYLKNCRLFFQ